MKLQLEPHANNGQGGHLSAVNDRHFISLTQEMKFNLNVTATCNNKKMAVSNATGPLGAGTIPQWRIATYRPPEGR